MAINAIQAAVAAATAAAIVPGPSLGALEDQLYGQLTQRMNEIRASWTRSGMGWTLLLAAATVGLRTLSDGIYQQYDNLGCFPLQKEEDCAFEDEEECFSVMNCSALIYVPLTVLGNTVRVSYLFSGAVAALFPVGNIGDRLLSLRNAFTQLRPQVGLNDAMFRTLSAVERTPQFQLLETPDSNKDLLTIQRELRLRRRFFFSVSILPKLTPIGLANPDFNSRMNTLIHTLLVDERGLEQMRDIRRCRQIIVQGGLLKILETVGIEIATAKLIVSYYIVRPLATERDAFEFNHPLFW
jgi:hypothetical protein